MILSDRQQQEFLKYFKKAEYSDRIFTFGPYDRAKCQYLYGILDDIGAGYSASHAGGKICFSCDGKEMEPLNVGYRCKKCKSKQDTPANSKGPFFVSVTFAQGEKVLKFVSELTNQTFDEITNGKYVTQPTRESFWKEDPKSWTATKETKKSKGRPKKIKENKQKFENVKVSFKGLIK